MWPNKPYTQLLAEQLSNNNFLIMARRGFSQGNIIENTMAAMKAGFYVGTEYDKGRIIFQVTGAICFVWAALLANYHNLKSKAS